VTEKKKWTIWQGALAGFAIGAALTLLLFMSGNVVWGLGFWGALLGAIGAYLNNRAGKSE